jgi:hypothetical protein
MEINWDKLPIIKITQKDKDMSKIVLSGIPNGTNKSLKGFLYYDIFEGEFVYSDKYNRFLNVVRAHLYSHWPNIKNWDHTVKELDEEDFEWMPHMKTYRNLILADKRLKKVNSV